MPRYRSFLLRVWCSSRHDRRRQWAARLEGLQDGQHRRFTDLETLIAELREVLVDDALDGPVAGDDTASRDPLVTSTTPSRSSTEEPQKGTDK